MLGLLALACADSGQDWRGWSRPAAELGPLPEGGTGPADLGLADQQVEPADLRTEELPGDLGPEAVEDQGGVPPDQGPDLGGSLPDQGEVVVDQGSAVPDQGEGVLDQGSAVPDQGEVVLDQGSAVPDQGEVVVDQGSAVPDQGEVVLDQGSPVPDQETADGGWWFDPDSGWWFEPDAECGCDPEPDSEADARCPPEPDGEVGSMDAAAAHDEEPDGGAVDADAPDGATTDAADGELPEEDPSVCPPGTFRLRALTGNLTSGNFQRIELPGRRILQGLQPDVALLQEFNVTAADHPADVRDFVAATFGAEFEYYREAEVDGVDLPNGVVSRYPIIEAGSWIDDQIPNRDFAWALIDLPGVRDLWAVSVHFSAGDENKRLAEARSLIKYLEDHVPPDDLLLLGGDLNSQSRGALFLQTLGQRLVVTPPWPVDQAGDGDTNATRGKPLDWLLAGPELDDLMVPVAIGDQLFPTGLVFDSRVYQPLEDVPPIQANDAVALGMQHMPVVKEFCLPAGWFDQP